MKKLVVFGACGSVGTSLIEVIKEFNDYEIVAISIDNNNDRNIFVLDKIKPKYALYQSNFSNDNLNFLKEKYSNITFLNFNLNYKKILKKYKKKYFFNSLPGVYGLKPLLEAIKLKYQKIFLANKESIVLASDIIKKLLSHHKKIEIIPIDSEHYALRRLLQNTEIKKIEKLIITASGGAVRNINYEDFKNLTKENILKHPTWQMGKEITVNSATMVNKIYEILEASFYFNFPISKIKVLINLESIIHAGIIFKDGTVFYNFSKPDMKHPIKQALKEPNIFTENSYLPSENLTINLLNLDYQKYPLIENLDYLFKNKLSRVLFCFANSYLVDLFLNDKIKFLDIINNLKLIMDNQDQFILNEKYDIDNIIFLIENKLENKINLFLKNKGVI